MQTPNKCNGKGMQKMLRNIIDVRINNQFFDSGQSTERTE